MRRTALLILAMAVMVSVASVATAATGEALFKKGNTLLEEGDLEGAYKAYVEAVQNDEENEAYRQQATMLRQVIRMRKQLARETDNELYSHFALALRSFYHEHEVFGEALALDKAAFKRLSTPESAANLAETHLLMNENKAAIALIDGLSDSHRSMRSQVYLATALARTDQMERAKSVAAALDFSEEEDAGLLFDGACMFARLGNTEKACAALTKCFKQTPPSLLDGGKKYAMQCADFASIKDDARFKGALGTKSTIKESKCSGGSGCGNCPSRSSCSKKK